MNLDTSWSWNANCAVPNLTQQHCYVSFTFNADYKNTTCYSYTYPSSGPDRRAAVYQGTIYLYDGPWTITQLEGQRRECHTSGSSSCTWTYWD